MNRDVWEYKIPTELCINPHQLSIHSVYLCLYFRHLWIFINIMKKEQIWGGFSVCLLLSCTLSPLLMRSCMEGEEYTNIQVKCLKHSILFNPKIKIFFFLLKKKKFYWNDTFPKRSTKTVTLGKKISAFLRLYIKTWSISGKLQVNKKWYRYSCLPTLMSPLTGESVEEEETAGIEGFQFSLLPIFIFLKQELLRRDQCESTASWIPGDGGNRR